MVKKIINQWVVKMVNAPDKNTIMTIALIEIQ
jgi:hypothetical protein